MSSRPPTKGQTMSDILVDIREQIELESLKTKPDLRFVIARVREVEAIWEDYKAQDNAMLNWTEFGKHVFRCPDCYDNLILNRELVLGGICHMGREMLNERHLDSLAESHTKRFLRDFS